MQSCLFATGAAPAAAPCHRHQGCPLCATPTVVVRMRYRLHAHSEPSGAHGAKDSDCLFSHQLFSVLVCNCAAKVQKKIMPSKFLAKNPLKILSENRIMSCISTTCNFLISVLFPCRHGTHSASRKSTRVSEYQSNISLFHFSFTCAPFLILYIIIYNNI